MFRYAPFFLALIALSISATAFGEDNLQPKAEVVQKKFPNAVFNEEQFTGTTVEVRKLAYLQNFRSAQEAHDKCAEAMKASAEYKTDEERTLAIKAYCPAPPAPDGFRLKAVDVACEIGEYCGKKFEVDKRDLRHFNAYFVRKVRYVAEAKRRGVHMDEVCSYACNKAKMPDRLAAYWFVRCLEEYKEEEQK